MTDLPLDFTWATLLTPAGLVIGAALVNRFVELVKAVSPFIDQRVSGATLAFAVSAVLYILAAVELRPLDANGALQLFAAWLSVSGTAVGAKAVTTHIASLGAP